MSRFVVARESPAQCLDSALEILNQTRPDPISRQRMHWLYNANPDGPAVVWTVRDEQSGVLAGFTVGLPRRMLVDGEPRTAWNCADFSVLPAYRTLGLAVKLRRAAREGVDAGQVDFLYAHPNSRMQLVHERAGHVAIGTMVRYAYVLRASGYLERVSRFPRVAGLAGKLADPLLSIRSRARLRRTPCQVRALEAPVFDARFDQLFASRAPSQGVVGVRDARYLDWRYAQNPVYATRAVVAEHQGQLRGYALYSRQERIVNLKDIFPSDDPDLLHDLVMGLVQAARREPADTISFWMLEGHPALPALVDLGFVRRTETSQMFAYAADSRPWRPAVLDRRRWYVTVGDRDI